MGWPTNMHAPGNEGLKAKRDGFSLSYAVWALVLLLYGEVMLGLSKAYYLYDTGDLLFFVPAIVAIVAWLFLILSNLIKWRWRRVVSVFVAPVLGFAPLVLVGHLGINADRLRFEYRESEMMKDVADSAASNGHPVLIHWLWGDQGGGFGASNIESKLIYDETDEIALPLSNWTDEVRGRLFNNSGFGHKKNYVDGSGLNPPGDGTSEPSIESIGGHFYLATQIE
jgi:hypothetical protein